MSTEKEDRTSSSSGPVMPERPQVLRGVTPRIRTGCGWLYLTINFLEDGRPVEMFAKIGKSGGCASSQCESIGRLGSSMLRNGLSVDLVIDQLRGISCSSQTGDKQRSCADAIAHVLEGWAKNGGKGPEEKP